MEIVLKGFVMYPHYPLAYIFKLTLFPAPVSVGKTDFISMNPPPLTLHPAGSFYQSSCHSCIPSSIPDCISFPSLLAQHPETTLGCNNIGRRISSTRL